jgi:arylsulfatase A-like enzyme
MRPTIRVAPGIRPGDGRGAALAALGLAVVLAAGCGEPPPRPAGPSLLWISLDTLRADHLGLYGYARDTSPFLDELAARGMWFEWAIAPQNSTLPSHLTMFTGYHPVVHGVMHSRKNPGVRLASSVRTLPRVLRDAGFSTRAWTDGGKVAGYYGFAAGFDVYDDAPTPLPEKLADVLAALEAQPAGTRFFYFVHTYEIHSPYAPPAPYDRRFGDGERGRSAARASLDAYDGSIRFVDDELRAFVGVLERRGLLDSLVLTITGDHGESFAEYGIPKVGHGGHNLHQNITRVPWLIVQPDADRRGAIAELCGLIDFPNTMLALLGIEERLPGGGVDVVSARAGGGSADGARAYVSYTGQAWSLYADGHHLLESEIHPGPERNALYDIRRDPREEAPLADVEKVAALRRRLEDARARLRTESDALTPTLRELGTLPDETREQLEALGYAVD